MTAGRIDPDRLVEQLGALAQTSRLAIMRLLTRYRPFGLPAGDIARLVAVPHNTLSSHLALLEQAGLVRSRRDGRSIIYAADALACARLSSVFSEELDPKGKRDGHAPDTPLVFKPSRDARPHTVLVLCTANSARSLMAEAMINREGKGRFRAMSAGSHPRCEAHPAAIRLLSDLGYDTTALHAKSWDLFARADAPEIDFVITVCDAAAGERCPTWPGHPLAAHWGIADPIQPGTSDAAQRAALLDAYRRLASRVTAFVNLPVASLDIASLRAELSAIGRMEGATALAMESAA